MTMAYVPYVKMEDEEPAGFESRPNSSKTTRQGNISHRLKQKFVKNIHNQLSLLCTKPAMIVLLWNLLVMGYETVCTLIVWRDYGGSDNIFFLTGLLAYYGLSQLILYPIAGWIAEVYLGRYFVIKLSMILIWIASLLLPINRIVHTVLPEHPADEWIMFAVFLINMVAFAGFQVNAIVYGIEQMPDVATEQIRTFIRWYYWTGNIGLAVMTLLALIVCAETDYDIKNTAINDISYDNGLILESLLSALCVSLALASDFLFGHLLNKKNVKTNPFLLIRKVLAYYMKHKYPVNRSAFTYNESYQPKRIDYGKTIYGGPFTSDEVEKVKTFLHMLIALVGIGLFYIVYNLFTNSANIVLNRINTTSYAYDSPELSCIKYDDFYWFINPCIISIFIPLYEIFLHPFLDKYIPKTLRRIGIAMTLHIIALGMLLILDEVGTVGEKNQKVNISLWWMLLPMLIGTLGEILGGIAALEFICAQSPSNFKGFMMGILFGVEGISEIISVTYSIPFSTLAIYDPDNSTVKHAHVFFTVQIVISLVILLLYGFIAVAYKRRERDPIPNEQLLIEIHTERMIKQREKE